MTTWLPFPERKILALSLPDASSNILATPAPAYRTAQNRVSPPQLTETRPVCGRNTFRPFSVLFMLGLRLFTGSQVAKSSSDSLWLPSYVCNLKTKHLLFHSAQIYIQLCSPKRNVNKITITNTKHSSHSKGSNTTMSQEHGFKVTPSYGVGLYILWWSQSKWKSEIDAFIKYAC